MPSRHRFFLPPESWAAGDWKLVEEEAHHCAKVFRHKEGDEIEIFDGQGNCRDARISAVRSREVQLEPQDEHAAQERSCFLTLAQAIPKGKNMDLIVQKSVELGVSCIVPLLTERTVVKASEGKDLSSKWRRVALEACKQCGQNWLPEVTPVQSLKEWAATDEDGLRLVAALTEDARSLKELVADRQYSSASILIGPEGDFTPDELQSLQSQEYLPLTLGPLVLRAETAALYALSILNYELGNSDPA